VEEEKRMRKRRVAIDSEELGRGEERSGKEENKRGKCWGS
jgi:hypothetical protein